MTRQHNGVLFVCQHILHFFVKRAARDLHRLAGQVIEPVFADEDPGDPSTPRHVELEILGARPQVSVDIATAERRVGFSNRRFHWMCHARKVPQL